MVRVLFLATEIKRSDHKGAHVLTIQKTCSFTFTYCFMRFSSLILRDSQRLFINRTGKDVFELKCMQIYLTENVWIVEHLILDVAIPLRHLIITNSRSRGFKPL